MAASNASRIQKSLSKIVSPSVGSPKKSIKSTSSPRVALAPAAVFKKPTGIPKQSISKVTKEVKQTLAPHTPARRPPSLPLSPWNADLSGVVKKAPSGTIVGGVKNKVALKSNLNPKPKPLKPVAPKKSIAPNIASKSTTVNDEEKLSKNGRKAGGISANSVVLAKRTNTAVTSKGQMEPTEKGKQIKASALVKPFSSSPDTSVFQSDTATKYSKELEVLMDEIDALGKRLHSTVNANPRPNPPPGESDTQITTHTNKTVVNFGSKNEENCLKKEIFNENDSNRKVGLTKRSPPKPVDILTPKAREAEKPVELEGRRSVPSQLPSPSYPRRSFDGTSPARRSLQSDKPWSPFGQPLPRVFERQYDNFADAIFAPYITDDENATTMSSQRYPF